MFKNLRNRWKVNGLQLALILVTFAVGGSLTGYVGRKFMNLLPIDAHWAWLIVYIIVIILLWPLAVIVVSLLTGQFRFFIKYIKRMGVRLRIVRSQEAGAGSSESGVGGREFRVGSQESGVRRQETKNPKLQTPNLKPETNIVILASGAGSNAQKIIDYFRNHSSIKVSLIACNNPDAGVLKIAARENIPSIIIEKEKFFRGNHYVDDLEQNKIGFIVLAGFLWKLPAELIQAFPNRIINIHPALLPNYGGKGMYGENVHAAVIAAGEKESGITIHYVDELYDNGSIIFQSKCQVLPGDTPATLAQRIHGLEHEYYPKWIEDVVGKLTS